MVSKAEVNSRLHHLCMQKLQGGIDAVPISFTVATECVLTVCAVVTRGWTALVGQMSEHVVSCQVEVSRLSNKVGQHIWRPQPSLNIFVFPLQRRLREHRLFL